MRIAIISDIHANLEALQVVLGHIDTQNVESIICLGDILGYGPNPVECVDLIADRCDWSLMGNHDFGVLYEPTNFNHRGGAGRLLDARTQFEAVSVTPRRAASPVGVPGPASRAGGLRRASFACTARPAVRSTSTSSRRTP